MPTLKTEILGSSVEINYEEAEKDKLIKIIEKFNERLSDLNHLKGKVTDNKILFLAALKAEDQVIDLINEDLNHKEKKIIREEQFLKINDLNQQIIKLKDEKRELNIENNNLQNLNLKALDKLDKLEKKLNNLIKKIVSQSKDNEE